MSSRLPPPGSGSDVLATDWRAPARGRSRPQEAVPGLVVEVATTGWVGAVVAVEKAGGQHVVHLEDRKGRLRAFPLGPGYLLDGAPVILTAPTAEQRAATQAAARARSVTASGSRAVADRSARVAVSSRILVEGRHDAELVEKIWGEDLRVEGVVVELLEGVDDLAGVVRSFGATEDRRLGVLVDHLVPGTKEHRIVEQATAIPEARWARVLGHPYVDVWQSVRPHVLGLQAWPHISRGTSWKHGILAHLGWPHADQRDVATGWKRILGQVDTYADLEPTLLAAVEELIDFVTEPTTAH